MRTRAALFGIAILFTACKRESIVSQLPCNGAQKPVANFVIKEVVDDTVFTTDTVYNHNPVRFEAVGAYDSVLWKIGSDPRDFRSGQFGLGFRSQRFTIPIVFTGYRQPNTQCFANDNGIYQLTKQLTVVECLDRATATPSSMVGQYKGAYTSTPLDSFVVRIEYFDSSKYRTDIVGSKNFHFISNLPKGYVDSTTMKARLYPELRNGFLPYMGYSGLTFGNSSTRGKA